MGIAGQVDPTQDSRVSSWPINTKCEQLSPSWCLINSACLGSASYSIRSRPDPQGSLTHLTTLFSILTAVTSPCAVHGPSVARSLTMRCFDNYSSNSLCCVLVPDTTNSSPSLNTDMSTALDKHRHKAKIWPCRIPSLSWHSHSQRRSIVQHPSFHVWLCPELRHHSYTRYLLLAP